MKHDKEFGKEINIESLFDLSLDIRRHDDDAAFIRSGGEIKYIFDVNIFELFLFPGTEWKRSDRGEGFSRSTTPAQEYKLRTAGQQTALVTAEILFGGELPGQDSGNIYVSRWHRYELLDRMTELLKKFGTKSAGNLQNDANELLKAKFGIWKDKFNSGERLKTNDPALVRDINELKKDFDGKSTTLESFRGCREAALFLAREEQIEPVQQLSRLLDPSFQKKIRRLQDIAEIPQSETKYFNRQAEIWATALKSEIKAQQYRNTNRRDRTRSSIWNDARTLTLIEWLNENLENPEKTRIVFVTGDSTLFDTYRRTYEEGNREWQNPGPFLLRKPVQFTPMFTHSNKKNLVVERGKLHYAIQQAVELSLIPIILSAISDKDLSDAILRKKNSVTLRPKEKEKANESSVLSRYWYDKTKGLHIKKLKDVEEQWAKAERSLVGLSRKQLLKRMNDDEVRIFSELTGEWDDSKQNVFSDYLERTIRKLYTDSLMIWRPVAESFFRKTMANLNVSKYRPILIVVNFGMFTSTVGKYNLFFDSNSLHESNSENVQFEKVFEVFVASSIASLLTNQWRLGEHYSELAITSYKYQSKRNPVTEEEAAEAYYLAALSKRFRMSNLKYDGTDIDLFRASKYYEEAEYCLSNSLKLARNLRKIKSGNCDHLLSDYRITSEEASLNLFRVLFLINHRSMNANTTKQNDDFRDYDQLIEYSLDKAKNCLIRCKKYKQELGSVDRKYVTWSEDLVERITSVFQIKICLYKIISCVCMGEKEDSETVKLSNVVIRNIDGVINSFSEPSSEIFLIELYAFLCINRIRFDESLDSFRSLVDSISNEFYLNSDKLIIKHMQQYLS